MHVFTDVCTVELCFVESVRILVCVGKLASDRIGLFWSILYF
jgi:hypothetical protein